LGHTQWARLEAAGMLLRWRRVAHRQKPGKPLSTCGGKCRGAKGPACDCQCGGKNHGINA